MNDNQSARYFRVEGQISKARRNETALEQKLGTKTISNNSEKAVSAHEPGALPAKTVQKYRDNPMETKAVRYVRINRVAEYEAKRNKQQEDNVRSAELDFMLDLETLDKETASDLDLIKLNCCLEDNNISQIPDDYKTVAKN